MTAVRRRTSPPKIALRRAAAFLEERGHQVAGARVCANGDILLLTDSALPPLPLTREQELDAEIAGLMADGEG